MSYVIKSADQTKTSDITAAVDSELVLALASGATYYVDALVMFRTGVTPAIKIGIGSTAATGLCCIYTEGCASRQPYQNASTSYSAVQSARLTSAGTYALGGSATGSDRGWFRARGVFITAGTGNIGIYWAQNVSNVGNTTVLAGSWIRLERLA